MYLKSIVDCLNVKRTISGFQKNIEMVYSIYLMYV